MLKYTTESFIQKIQQKDKERGVTYDYSKFEYKGTCTKSTIICPTHGEFQMIPNNRLNGQDCYYCGKLKNISPLEKRNESFLKRAKENDLSLGNTQYSYDKFIYQGNSVKGIVTCSIHGDFEVAPKHKIYGHGCPFCSKDNKRIHRVPTKEWIYRFKRVHKNKYVYPLLIEGGNKKIPITCKVHGVFYQTPESHVAGSGCRKCSQLLCTYRKEDWIKKANGKSGTFYIIKCFNTDETFYKVGITFNSLKTRYKNKKEMPYDFEVIKEIKSSNLSDIWDLEKETIKQLKSYHYTPLIPFRGSFSECFTKIEN